jgi:hypothetical protein
MTTISVTAGDNPQGAANLLQPGDTLLFKAGTHYGRISIPVDGVVIAGEIGAILEGTQPLESEAWTLATDSDGYTSLAGTGTWRVPLSQWPWQVLEPNGVSLMRIDSDYVGVQQTSGYYYMTAYGAMAVPNNARPGPDYYADWWNGIEAMWVYNTHNQHLYVRYRDGKRPGSLRWSGGVTDHREPPRAGASVIWLAGRRDVTVQGLEIRGCVDGVAVYDSTNITIENCFLSNFDFGVRAYGACSNIRVLECVIDLCELGTIAMPPIAKTSSENPYPDARLTTAHVYSMHKFFHDESDSTHGCGFSIYDSETGIPRQIEFAGNEAMCSAYAVTIFGGDGIDIHHNVIEHMWDLGIQRFPNGRNIQIHDNVFHESGYCMMRWHYADREAGENFIFNNRISDIDRVSDFVAIFGSVYGKKSNWFSKIIEFLIWLWYWVLGKKPPVKASASNLRMWWYNNSFSGGNSVWIMYALSSMPGFCAVNNVLSNNGNTANAADWPATVGLFDYNSMSGALGAWGSWYGGHNVTMMPPIWSCAQVERDFIVPDGHSTKGTGIDVSRPFVINGQTYGPLPGFEPGYFFGAAPDRGWIDRGDDDGGGEIVAATLTATPDAVVPGATVTLSWTGSASARDWFALYDSGQSHAFDKYGWAYCSSCSATLGTLQPSGSCTIAMPADVGTYEFRLYANDTDTQLAVSNMVTVEEAEPEPEPDEETMLVYVPALLKGGELVPVEDSEVLKRFIRKKKKR